MKNLRALVITAAVAAMLALTAGSVSAKPRDWCIKWDIATGQRVCVTQPTVTSPRHT